MIGFPMSTSPASGGPAAGSRPLSASGATVSPWLRILIRCLIAGLALLLAVAAAAAAATGVAAALSVLLGGAIVMVFFGISLLIGHLVGRTNPSGAIGMFAVTYLIKVVGFAVALFTLGMPAWLDKVWFGAAAIVVVVVWQGVEVFVFSRSRHQLYNDEPEDRSV